MKILAIEFSSEKRSVAIVDGDAANARLRGGAKETGGRNACAFALIEDALKQAQMQREQIDCVAIGTGPGSYAGIRAAIALAQGWQLAQSIKVLGVSSIECLAAQAQIMGNRGRISVIVDAQRNEFYLATYEIAANIFKEVEPLHIVSLAEIEQRISNGQNVLGPEATRTFAGAKELFPAAATLGYLAFEKTNFIDSEKLEPIYLREISFVRAPPPRLI